MPRERPPREIDYLADRCITTLSRHHFTVEQRPYKSRGKSGIELLVSGRKRHGTVLDNYVAEPVILIDERAVIAVHTHDLDLHTILGAMIRSDNAARQPSARITRLSRLRA